MSVYKKLEVKKLNLNIKRAIYIYTLIVFFFKLFWYVILKFKIINNSKFKYYKNTIKRLDVVYTCSMCGDEWKDIKRKKRKGVNLYIL